MASAAAAAVEDTVQTAVVGRARPAAAAVGVADVGCCRGGAGGWARLWTESAGEDCCSNQHLP